MASTCGGDTSGDELTGALESFPSEFASWEELEEFVGDFGATTFQVFRKRTSVTAALRNSAIVKRLAARGAQQLASGAPLIPEALRFYSKTYVCTHGLKNTPRGAGRRTHAAIRATGCTARIHATLRFSAAKRAYVVAARVSGSHNHPVSRAQYFSYAENRRIDADPALLRAVADMAARGETPRAILDHLAQRVHETTGGECVYKLKDIHNVLARLKSDPRALLSTQDAAGAERVGESDDVARTTADSAAAIVASMAANLGGSGAGHALVSGSVELHEGGSATDAATDAATGAAASETSAAQNASPPASLARLEILLDSSYTYHSAHAEVNSLANVATELVENTISRLKFEVVRMPPGHQSDDVAFVLPKHALAGCEAGISEFYQKHKLLPQAVGVRLPVATTGPQGRRWLATLSSRQLLTMKKLHVARSNVAAAQRAIDWVRATNISAYPSPPFDEFSSYTKDLITSAVRLMPLTKVMVCGTRAGGHRFIDALYCASLLQLSSSENINLECVKAALLHMHARFHHSVGFVNPQFAFEADLAARCAAASAYGAFDDANECIAGLSQLPSGRWSAFYYDCGKQVCCLCAPTEAERDVAAQIVAALFAEFGRTPTFETSLIPPASAAARDSGVLALLFVECMLHNATWGENPIDSFDYFRVRYLLHAIQVAHKQDVHDVATK